MPSERANGVVERRRQFRANRATAVAEAAAGGPVEPVIGRGRLSGRLLWYQAPGKLVVVAGPYKDARDGDLALAHGLRHVTPDQILVLVLPQDERASRATTVRAPWINVPLEIYNYDLPLVEGGKRGEPAETSRCPILERSWVLQQYRDAGPDGWGYGIESPPRPPSHAEVLGEKAPWVTGLTTWLTAHDDLEEEHTDHYLAWRCAGTIVLTITVGRQLTMSAGVQHSRSGQRPSTVLCSGVLPASDQATLEEAALQAIDKVLGGLGERYREHRLQAAIVQQGPKVLGLVDPLKAERAAWRPYPGGRAFLDFLGVDEHGVLHIVETKVGADAMMVLQGLDYWIWASANQDALAPEFGRKKVTGIEVDFLIDEGKGSSLGPYSMAQSESLATEVVHRFWTISDWDTGGMPQINPLVPR